MQPTVFAIGVKLPTIDRFTVLSMTSNESWLDADIIVVEPHIDGFDTSKGNPPRMSEASSTNFRAFRARFQRQLKTALQHGKIVVFLLPDIEVRSYYAETHQRTLMTSNYALSGVSFEDANHVKGRQMSLTDSGKALTEYWKMMGPKSQYQCLFGARDVEPIITTLTGGQMCGCVVRGQGHLYLLPSIDWTQIDDWEEQNDPMKPGFGYKVGQITLATQLRRALEGLHKNLTVREPPVEAPAWVSAAEYNVGREPVIQEELARLRTEADRLAVRQIELEVELKGEQSLKTLLFGTGRPLEEAVRQALSLLGFEAENYVTADSEFDVVFTSTEGRFIGEIEGRDSKPIAVEKAGQLHRNLTEDFARDEVSEMARGVLFGNAFRMQPTEARAEVFTEKVIKFSETVSITLVRTPDLFRAVQHFLATNDTDFAAACRQAIASSAGSIVSFPIPAD